MNEFEKNLKACYKNEQKTIKELQKAKTKNKQIKLNLQLLGYNTKCINMLQLGKDLQIIDYAKANEEITKRLLENKEIYNKLLLLKQ